MDNKNVKWVIEGMLWEDGIIEKFEKSLNKQNINYIITSPEESRNGFEKLGNKEECIIFYGSLETAKLIRETKKWIPGIYYSKQFYDCSFYYPYLGRYLLNGNKYCFLPYGDLIRNKEFIFTTFGEDNAIFIRPDKGDKPFTGKCVYKENFEREIEIAGFYGFSNNQMVLISTPKNIEKEWRFFVVNKNIITGSLYRVGNNRVALEANDYEAKELAEHVASGEYQPDRAWVLDVCKTKCGNYYVLEVGCFSCSGMYGSDIDKIVDSISLCAVKEYEEYQNI